MTFEEIETHGKMLEKIILRLEEENQRLREQLYGVPKQGILFADWITEWLQNKRDSIKINTYQAYTSQINLHIVPYFREKGLMVSEITPKVLEDYYLCKKSSGLSSTTIRKHHSNICAALQSAMKNNLIPSNPALLADLPLGDHFSGNYLSVNQFRCILSHLENSVLYTPVLIAGIMGLRRSEVLGLRWSDLNLQTRTMCIQHTVVKSYKDHKLNLVFSDVPKTKTSRRTLPMPEKLCSYLENLREKQCLSYMQNQSYYSRRYLKYICVDHFGELITPDRLSVGFGRAVKELNIRCRFHDLRHTCASLLVQHGVNLKLVSAWLGHNSISVTSDIYTHLTYKDKQLVAQTIDSYMTD